MKMADFTSSQSVKGFMIRDKTKGSSQQNRHKVRALELESKGELSVMQTSQHITSFSTLSTPFPGIFPCDAFTSVLWPPEHIVHTINNPFCLMMCIQACCTTFVYQILLILMQCKNRQENSSYMQSQQKAGKQTVNTENSTNKVRKWLNSSLDDLLQTRVIKTFCFCACLCSAQHCHRHFVLSQDKK